MGTFKDIFELYRDYKILDYIDNQKKQSYTPQKKAQVLDYAIHTAGKNIILPDDMKLKMLEAWGKEYGNSKSRNFARHWAKTYWTTNLRVVDSGLRYWTKRSMVRKRQQFAEDALDMISYIWNLKED